MTGHPGTGTSTDPDEDRWAEALSVLEQRPTTAATHRVRRQRTMTWVIIATALVLCGAVGVLLGETVLPVDGAATNNAPWREGASFALILVGLVVEVVGFVGMARAGLWGSRWRSPTSVLTRPQRRSLVRQVLGRAPADVRRLPLARDLARRLAASRALVVMYGGVVIMQVAQALEHTSLGWVVYALAMVVLFAGSAVLTERQGRRARRFLREHPSSAS